MSIYDVVIFEEYEKDGEKKSFSHKVGTAFDSKGGDSINVVIPPGISVSGRFTILPRKEKSDAP